MKAKIIDPEMTLKNARRTLKAEHERPIRRSAPPHSATPYLELFQREDSTDCHAVRRLLSTLGLDFVAHSMGDHDPLKHEQLIQIGGKDQIPFILDHRSGVKLYGSYAITAYLENEYGEPERTQVFRISQLISEKLEENADRIAWRVKKPMEKFNEISRDARDGIQTIRGAFEWVKDTVNSLLDRDAA